MNIYFLFIINPPNKYINLSIIFTFTLLKDSIYNIFTEEIDNNSS